MIVEMKFPKQLYLGLQDEAFSTETYPLGFATPYGEDAAFRKRKETVDRWVPKQRYQTIKKPDGTFEHTTKQVNALLTIIDNVPLEGFQLGSAVSRYSTSNKWFEILDPRGFKVQISSYNLQEICQKQGISKGILQGRFLYGRDKSNNYLISDESVEYLSFIKPVVNVELKPGDVINHRTRGNRLTFVGKFFFKEYKVKYTWTGSGTKYTPEEKASAKASYVFTGLGYANKQYILTMSSIKSTDFEVIEYDADYLRIVTSKMYSKNDDSYKDTIVFFDNKTDQKSEDFFTQYKDDYKRLYMQDQKKIYDINLAKYEKDMKEIEEAKKSGKKTSTWWVPRKPDYPVWDQGW